MKASSVDEAWSHYLDEILKYPARLSSYPDLVRISKDPKFRATMKRILVRSVPIETKTFLAPTTLSDTQEVIEAFVRIAGQQRRLGVEKKRGTHAILFWNTDARPVTIKFKRGTTLITITIRLAVYNGKTLNTFFER